MHATEKFHTPPPLGMRGENFATRNVKRGKQGGRAVPLIVVALAGQSPTAGPFEIVLRPLKGLDRRLFVYAQHNGLSWRIDIKAHDIGRFGAEFGVVALGSGLARHEIDLVDAQEMPDILDINVTQFLGQQRPRPAREPLRRGLVQKSQNPLVRRRRIERPLARPQLVAKARKPFIDKAVAPKANDPRLHTHVFGDRSGATTFGNQEHNPGALQIALHRPRRTAPRLQLLPISAGKPNFSCFGNHPYLESRVTFLEKGVLDRGTGQW